MSKITQADKLLNRRCGLKYYDKALNLVGQQRILDIAIGIAIRFPTIGAERMAGLTLFMAK